MKGETSGLRTWIEVRREAIKSNVEVFRSLISPKTKLMVVVKSNAYGHSLLDFAKEAEMLGADFFGVDSIVEALALRKNGIKAPILVLGYTLHDMIPAAVEADISLTVSSFETVEAIEKCSFPKPLKIHVKVDTGMHRQGFLLEQQKTLTSKLKTKNSKLIVEGLYTHFAAAKNPAFPQDTKAQMVEFKIWIDAFKKAGFNTINHAAATAGTMLFPESHFDMVRVGIGLYGLWPAKEVEAFFSGKIKLQPVLSWKTIIGEIKKIPKGSRVGYDLTEQVAQDSTLAVCPIGYWHGFPRSLSSVGHVLVNGHRAKIIGRVSMDMITIDITGITEVSLEDEVVLIGKQGELTISAEDVAYLSDSSWYEIVTRLNPLIKRLYL